MKKILVFLGLLFCLKSFAQFPVKQTLGSDSTLVESKGGMKSRLINKPFVDTTQANLQRVRFYDGSQIYTTSGGGALWLRDSTANKWVPVGGGTGSGNLTPIGTRYQWGVASTPRIKGVLMGDNRPPDTTASDIIIRTVGERSYGLIYYDSSWNSVKLSDHFDVSGATVTDSAGVIVVSGSSLTHTLKLDVNSYKGITDYFTALENWTQYVEIKVIQKGNGFAAGLVGSQTTGPVNAVGNINTSTGESSFLVNSASNLTINIGDVIGITVNRSGFKTSISVRNITTNSATITTESSYVLPSSSLPTIGQFGFFIQGGKYYIRKYKVWSNTLMYASALALGDSKTVGYNADNLTRWTTQLGDYFHSVVTEASGFSTTADWLTILPEVLSLKPTVVLMTNPSNNLRLSVNVDTTKAQYYRFERPCRDAGILVYHLDGFKETSVDPVAWVDYVNTKYSPDSIIHTYQATNIAGTVAADNVHLNSFGNVQVAQEVITSDKIKNAVDRLNASSSNILNQTDVAQTGGFYIGGNKTSKIEGYVRLGNGIATSSLATVPVIIKTQPNSNIFLYGNSGLNYIASYDDGLSTSLPLQIRSSTFDVLTGSGPTNALSIASTQIATFSKNLNVGVGSALGGTVAVHLHTHTSQNFDLYSDGTNNNFYSADDSRTNGLTTNFVTGTASFRTSVSSTEVERIGYSTAGVVINEPGAAVNTRIESDNNANMIFVDANDKVGIGTALPTHTLTVNGQVRITAINNASAFDSVLFINDGVPEAGLASAIVGAIPTLQQIFAGQNFAPALTHSSFLDATTKNLTMGGANAILRINDSTGNSQLIGRRLDITANSPTGTNGIFLETNALTGSSTSQSLLLVNGDGGATGGRLENGSAGYGLNLSSNVFKVDSASLFPAIRSTIPTTADSTYLPTLTSVTNVASSSVSGGSFHYIRRGTQVIVSGVFTVTPTAGTSLTQVAFSLPVASNFLASQDATGNCTAVGSTYNAGMASGDVTNDRIQIDFTSSNTSAHTVSFNVMYTIK